MAVLNWGLGHATRCIPIIKALQANHYNVIIASDGDALLLLKKYFPELLFEVLPAYKIAYKKGGFGLKGALLKSSFYNYPNYKKEQLFTQQLIQKHQIKGLISDNRFGVFSNEVPSVYITHQIRVFSGLGTYFTSKFHQKIINKHKECWVPDYESDSNLSGALSHQIKLKIPIKYIEPISQFTTTTKNKNTPIDCLIIISGIEPERSKLEEKLKALFKKSNYKTILIQGRIAKSQNIETIGNLTIYNYALTEELQQLIQNSKTVICRSGYSSIMDMANLQKKVFFIPTTGQNEQEYLAKHLKKQNIAPFANQNKFCIEDLEQLTHFNGFNITTNTRNWQELFQIFE